MSTVTMECRKLQNSTTNLPIISDMPLKYLFITDISKIMPAMPEQKSVQDRTETFSTVQTRNCLYQDYITSDVNYRARALAGC